MGSLKTGKKSERSIKHTHLCKLNCAYLALRHKWYVQKKEITITMCKYKSTSTHTYKERQSPLLQPLVARRLLGNDIHEVKVHHNLKQPEKLIYMYLYVIYVNR